MGIGVFKDINNNLIKFPKIIPKKIHGQLIVMGEDKNGKTNKTGRGGY